MKEELKTVMLIDDNKDIVEAVQLLLEDEGYLVKTADGITYLEIGTTPPLPDVILLDLLLSGTDGREIIHTLKNRVITKHIPIILTSAYPDAQHMWKAAGADDFIAKPFDITYLLSVIERHV